MGDLGSIPGSGRFPGEGNGNPLQYSCLENPMDRGAWSATVHGVGKSWTQLSDFPFFLFLVNGRIPGFGLEEGVAGVMGSITLQWKEAGHPLCPSTSVLILLCPSLKTNTLPLPTTPNSPALQQLSFHCRPWRRGAHLKFRQDWQEPSWEGPLELCELSYPFIHTMCRLKHVVNCEALVNINECDLLIL